MFNTPSWPDGSNSRGRGDGRDRGRSRGRGHEAVVAPIAEAATAAGTAKHTPACLSTSLEKKRPYTLSLTIFHKTNLIGESEASIIHSSVKKLKGFSTQNNTRSFFVNLLMQ